jgi:hypothetical protein
MGPFSFIYLHWKSCLWILLYFIIAFTPSILTIFKYKKQYIIDNWAYLKTKPLYAPFAGLVRTQKGQGVVKAGIKNILGCLWKQIKVMFALLMKPFRFIISIFHKVLSSMTKIMDVFRQQMAVIRKFLEKIIQSVMGRLENLAATFVNIFFRLRDMMHRSFATFKMMSYILEVVALTMKSMMNGPVGGMLRFSGNLGYIATYFLLGPVSFLAWPELWNCLFCFGATTPIRLANRTTKPIVEVQLGEQLQTGKVIGVLKFYPKRETACYQHGSDIVTATHPVWDGKRWIFVRDHPDYHPIHYSGNLYCLATDNHQITTPTATYLDWEETDDTSHHYRLKLEAVVALNPSNYSVKIDKCHLYQEGFSHFNNRQLNDNNVIEGEGTWLATVTDIWYCLSGERNGYLVTGSTLVELDGIWHQVSQDNRFMSIDPSNTPKYIYHFKTGNGMVCLGKERFRDLMEQPTDH